MSTSQRARVTAYAVDSLFDPVLPTPDGVQRTRAKPRRLRSITLAVALVACALGAAVPGRAQAAAQYRIYSAHDWRCLDADVSSPTHNGTNVQAWGCNGWPNQLWNYYYTDNTIRSAKDGRCLDENIAGSPTHNGTNIQIWDCNGFPNQKWYLYDNSIH